MRSSSTEPPAGRAPDEGGARAPGGSGVGPATGRRGFWPADTGAWVRLALAGLLGVGAVVAPAVGTTGAVDTDSETTSFEVFPSVSPAPTDAATGTAAASSPGAADDAVASQTRVPATLSARPPAPASTATEATTTPAAPSGLSAATSSGTSSPAASATPTPTPSHRTSWPVWPVHH